MVSKLDLIFPSLILENHSLTLANLFFSPIMFDAKTELLAHHEIADCTTYCKSASFRIGQCWLAIVSRGRSCSPSRFFIMYKISVNLGGSSNAEIEILISAPS